MSNELVRGEWRCFHCNELFTNEFDGKRHFGDRQESKPACLIDIVEIRAMERELFKLRMEEDGPKAREFYALGAEHATALRREEEKGYARGLRDAKHVEPLTEMELIHKGIELACAMHGRVPDGYTITLELTGEDCSLSVTDPNGEDVHFDHERDEPGIVTAIHAAIAHNMETV